MKPCVPLLLAAALGATSAGAQILERFPYPQNLGSNSVEILWRTDVPTESWVEVRPESGGESVVYSCTVPTTAHQMTVPGLKPDTRYVYRVGTAKDRFLTEEPIPFQTFPAGDLPTWSFMAYGDHRNYVKDHRAVVEAAIAHAKQVGWPRFVVDTGDYTGQGEHKTDFWNEQFFEPARGLIERVCYFPIIGNHEAPTRHPRIPHRYLANFSVPTASSGTEYYYSFDFADAHFTMVDAYSTEFVTGSKQYEWIKQDLKKSKKRWKFVVIHYPVFIHRSGPTVSYGNHEIREHLVPLFERYGVAAVFSGDSHFYQRSEVNGIPYICTGGGGAPLYDPGNGRDYVRASKKVHHYCWVTITGDRMKVDVYDTKNELIDTLTTGPRESQEPKAPPLNYVRLLPDAAWTTSGRAIIVESRDVEGRMTSKPHYAEEVSLADSTAKSGAEGVKGVGSRFSDNTAADARVTFQPPVPEKGTYLFSVTVPAAASVDAPNTVFEVTVPGGEVVRGLVPLTSTAAGDRWYDVGLVDLAPGATITLIEAEDEPDRFYADSIRLIPMKKK